MWIFSPYKNNVPRTLSQNKHTVNQKLFIEKMQDYFKIGEIFGNPD
jgi:hypothetical protein